MQMYLWNKIYSGGHHACQLSSNDGGNLLHNWTEVQWYQALSGDAEKKEAIGLYSSVLRADAGMFTLHRRTQQKELWWLHTMWRKPLNVTVLCQEFIG